VAVKSPVVFQNDMKSNRQDSPKEENIQRINTSKEAGAPLCEVLDVTDLDEVRKAFVLSEIINRKY